jgi:hypothetical protein
MNPTLIDILTGLAGNVVAPLVKGVLENKIGVGNTALVETVVKSIAAGAGVPVEALPQTAQSNPALVEQAIVQVESITPYYVDLYKAGVAGQFALLQAESAEGPWQSGWRWGWMYLLAFFWLWRIVILPVVNAALGSSIEAIDLGIMLTLTSWFIAMYMGGHTIKDLGTKAIEAVREWKGKSA